MIALAHSSVYVLSITDRAMGGSLAKKNALSSPRPKFEKEHVYQEGTQIPSKALGDVLFSDFSRLEGLVSGVVPLHPVNPNEAPADFVCF